MANEYDLPDLPEDWEWRVRSNGSWAACLFTWEYDCIVEVSGGSVQLSTGVAPIVVVEAVIRANTRKTHERTSNCSCKA